MATSESEVIGRFKKNDTSEIVGSVTKFRDEVYIDLREYIESERYSGPTKKGVRFHVECWEDFRQLVEEINKHIQDVS